MAMDIEVTIFHEVGMPSHYNQMNGSGSCGGRRKEWLHRLPAVMEKHGLVLEDRWKQFLDRMDKADGFDGGDLTCTNVWLGINYAVRSAVYIYANGNDPEHGIDPMDCDLPQFCDKAKDAMWKLGEAIRGTKEDIARRYIRGEDF